MEAAIECLITMKLVNNTVNTYQVYKSQAGIHNSAISLESAKTE